MGQDKNINKCKRVEIITAPKESGRIGELTDEQGREYGHLYESGIYIFRNCYIPPDQIKKILKKIERSKVY